MEPVTVATFNIRHGLGTDGVVDLERTAAVITESGADLVALQEVDRHRARSGGVDQAARLAELTGLRLDFCPVLHSDAGEYGIALGYRGEATSRYEPLPRVANEEPRGAIVASWNGLTVVATHLSNLRTAKLTQLRAVAGLAVAADGPAVILGDFNLGRLRLRPLTRAGFVAGPRKATFVRRFGSPAIDHILVRGGPRIVRAWTIASPASDHLLLAAALLPA